MGSVGVKKSALRFWDWVLGFRVWGSESRGEGWKPNMLTLEEYRII